MQGSWLFNARIINLLLDRSCNVLETSSITVSIHSSLMAKHDLFIPGPSRVSTSDHEWQDQLQGQFLAELLTQTAPQLADHAACMLMARYPESLMRYGSDSLNKWRNAMHGRLLDLAAALAAGQPSLFAEQISWAKMGIEARRAPVEDLHNALECLIETLSHELPEEDRAQAIVFLQAGLAALNVPEVCGAGTSDAGAAGISGEHMQPLMVDSATGVVAGKYLLALLEGDRRRASTVVNEAVAHGLSARDAYQGVLIPVLRELGRMWHLAEISIAEEHFATATTLHIMSQLASKLECKPSNGKSILICAVEGNTHEIGPRVISDFFEAEGWRVIYLSGDIPIDEVAPAARTFKADIIALSAMLRVHIRAAEATIQHVRAHAPGVPVMVGGPAFAGPESIWRDIGADALANTHDQAILCAAALVEAFAAAKSASK